MSAFERFLAGEDRLSAVLLALPEHEAPETLAAKIREAALSAEKHRQSVENRPAKDGLFTPPASLETAVLRQAETLHAAQRERRRAILRQVTQEEDLSRLFGGTLSEEAKDWLRRMAQSETQETPAPPETPAPFWRRWGFTGRHSFALGWAFCLVMLCGLVLRLYDVPWPGASAPGSAAQEAEKFMLADAGKPDRSDDLTPPPPPAAPARPPLPAAEPVRKRADAVNEMSSRKPAPLAAEVSRAAPAPEEAVVAAAPSLETRSHALESKRDARPETPERQAAGIAAADAHSEALSRNKAELVLHYPANAAQWQKIAAAMTPPPDGQTFVWQLFAGDPQNAQVQALADTLRHTLPDGHTLRLRADPDLAAIEARLERQTREKK